MQKIDRKEFVQGVAALGAATAAGISFEKEGKDMKKAYLKTLASENAFDLIDKSILEKWYGPQPGGSLHDVYVVEIEGVYEG